MKFLNGQDNFFFYSEAGNNYQHICSTLLLDPSTAKGDFTIDSVKAMFLARLHHLPSFKQRLLTVAYNMGPPAFVDDPDFDIDNHFHQIDLPNGASLDALAELTSAIVSEPLDTDIPLWKVVYVTGLEGNKRGLIFQLHHCMIDGHGGGELAQNFYDLEPVDPETIQLELEALEKEKTSVKELPSKRELAWGSTQAYYNNRPKLMDVVTGKARGALEARKEAKKIGFEKQPFTRLFFNQSATPNRTVEFGSASLEDVKFIKNAFGVKVNDIVMAATSLSLRDYLKQHDDCPDCPITACVAVDIHDTKAADTEAMNHVGMMGVDLPVQLEDPSEVVTTIFDSSQKSKKVFASDYHELLANVTDLMPSVTSVFMSQYAKRGLGAKLPQPYNLAISNNPGAPFPLYCAGAKIEHIYPAGPVVEGQCLNVTIISYQGSIDICVGGCTELTPDIKVISNGIISAIATLKTAAVAFAAEKEAEEKAKQKFAEAPVIQQKTVRRKRSIAESAIAKKGETVETSEVKQNTPAEKKTTAKAKTKRASQAPLTTPTKATRRNKGSSDTQAA